MSPHKGDSQEDTAPGPACAAIPGQGPREGLQLLQLFCAMKDRLKNKSKLSSWAPAIRAAPAGLFGKPSHEKGSL